MAAISPSSLESCQKFRLPCFNASRYASDARSFKSINWAKIKLARDALKLGYNVHISDLDVSYLKPVQLAIREVFSWSNGVADGSMMQEEWVYQDNADDVRSRRPIYLANTGVIFLKANERSIKFLDSMLHWESDQNQEQYMATIVAFQSWAPCSEEATCLAARHHGLAAITRHPAQFAHSNCEPEPRYQPCASRRLYVHAVCRATSRDKEGYLRYLRAMFVRDLGVGGAEPGSAAAAAALGDPGVVGQQDNEAIAASGLPCPQRQQRAWRERFYAATRKGADVEAADVARSVDQIRTFVERSPLALRLSGQLLLGAVRIHAQQRSYLLEECEAFLLRSTREIAAPPLVHPTAFAAAGEAAEAAAADQDTTAAGRRRRRRREETAAAADITMPAQNYDLLEEEIELLVAERPYDQAAVTAAGPAATAGAAPSTAAPAGSALVRLLSAREPLLSDSGRGGSAFVGGPFEGGAGFGGDPYALYDDSQELMRVPSSMAAEWLGQPPLGGEFEAVNPDQYELLLAHEDDAAAAAATAGAGAATAPAPLASKTTAAPTTPSAATAGTAKMTPQMLFSPGRTHAVPTPDTHAYDEYDSFEAPDDGRGRTISVSEDLVRVPAVAEGEAEPGAKQQQLGVRRQIFGVAEEEAPAGAVGGGPARPAASVSGGGTVATAEGPPAELEEVEMAEGPLPAAVEAPAPAAVAPAAAAAPGRPHRKRLHMTLDQGS
ncbi:hypothetical protein GPECTOR_21g760 [Gonium pectorale]|uniref:Nucleotide-diphospho-sugar transferase domain-containing protein n=1 Tax=Gonium pectorale TaxID=33097 RepID=A0A150GI80_GONPE|nr:hypothetical protein GPECTOR_21g760 [Gonium pectorale]|eukprot:KXZ49532.1 hypothetical protein GPECTOR_21g760 [Gonium pectorale]